MEDCNRECAWAGLEGTAVGHGWDGGFGSLSGPPYPLGVATICRACGLDVGGHQANDMLI